MSPDSIERDPYLLRGALVMAAAVALALLQDGSNSAMMGLYAAVFVIGALVAVGSPTRWSVRTTLRLYMAVPLLFGLAGVAFGGYFMLTTDARVLATVPLVWGLASLFLLVGGPWDAVESHLERLQARERDDDEMPLPLPREQLLQLRYAGLGLLTAGAAVVATQFVVDPDPGQLAILAGVGGAGLLTVGCSPFSGPPERVVRLRKARWAVLGAGTAVSSLYGGLIVGVQLPAVFWGLVTLGVLYWSFVRTPWEDVGDAVASVQAGTGTTDE